MALWAVAKVMLKAVVIPPSRPYRIINLVWAIAFLLLTISHPVA